MEKKYEEEGISLIELFKIMFSKKKLMGIIILATIIVGVIFTKFFFNVSKEKYVLSYQYSIRELDDGKYCDGSTFNYLELVSLNNLKEIKNGKESYGKINVDKMFIKDHIQIIKTINSDETNGKQSNFYSIYALAYYFDSTSQATSFLSDIASYPCVKTLQIAKENNDLYFVDLFNSSSTYETQIDYVLKEKQILVNNYQKYIEYYGDLTLSSGNNVSKKIEDIQLYFINYNISLLVTDIEENGYVKKSEQNKLYLLLLKNRLSNDYNQNELKITALKTERDNVAGSTVENVEEYDKKIVELILCNIDINREIEIIDLKLGNIDGTVNESFEVKLNKFRDDMKLFIEEYEKVEQEIYTIQSKIFIFNNKAIQVGGVRLLIAGGASIALGLVIGCITNTIIYYIKKDKEKETTEQ